MCRSFNIIDSAIRTKHEGQCFDCDDIRTDLVLSEWGDDEMVCPGCEARRAFEYGLPPKDATGSSSSLLCEVGG